MRLLFTPHPELLAALLRTQILQQIVPHILRIDPPPRNHVSSLIGLELEVRTESRIQFRVRAETSGVQEEPLDEFHDGGGDYADRDTRVSLETCG